MSPISKIVASAAFLASFAVAAPRWQECKPGTWYSKCGDIEGCFDHDPCVAAPAKNARWQECEPGTWYSKCGKIEGCFNHDPCVNQHASTLNARWQECEPGTWYSKCGAIEGCFDHDPCVDPPAASAPACPTDPNEPGVRTLPSAYWPISPETPDDFYFAVDDFHVYNNTQGVIQNVLVFEGIDVTRAKTCKVGWYVNFKEDTVFEVEGDGYLRITHLDGISGSDMPPTFNSAAAFETEDSMTTMPALGGWDDLRGTTSNHVEVPCSEVMMFRAYLDEINNGGGEIYMQPSDTVGLSVDYWC
ncbi:hypothetical protein DL768_003855 [Monosporascus sp. mg162]|nr:hypothetical protein DL768_003855 [Monosporascus sp. mg162]